MSCDFLNILGICHMTYHHTILQCHVTDVYALLYIHMQPIADEEHAAADDQCGQPSTRHLPIARIRKDVGKTSADQTTVYC